jgi:hypothetical protein
MTSMSSRHGCHPNLFRLQSSLPRSARIGKGLDVDSNCRAALSLAIERAADNCGKPPPPDPQEEGAGGGGSGTLLGTTNLNPLPPAGKRKGNPNLPEIPADPATCPNCGNPVASDRTPYCSVACRAQAAFVRQVRSGIRDGAIFDEERQIALGEKFWCLLGGGYPRRRSLVPEKTRSKVIAREKGRCEGCGAPAVTIDHAGSG